MKISLALLHVVVIFYCVYALGKKWNVVSSKLFWGAFLSRLVAGISLGLIYTFYYSASDTWQFFENAKKLSSIAYEDFYYYLKVLLNLNGNEVVQGLESEDLRSLFFIKIVSVLSLVSGGNYWVCAFYFSLGAFVSSWGLHRKIVSIYPNSFDASALAFLFFPSVVFWSSGLEKESLALCGIYFLATVFLTLMAEDKPSKFVWLFVIVACVVVWNLKYYWAIIFFVSIFSATIIRFIVLKFSRLKKYLIVVWVALFFGIGFVLSFTHPNFYLHRFLEVIVSNYEEFVSISNAKNLIHYFHFDQSWISMIINSPWALISGLFRPVIGEGQGILGFVASIENLLLLILFAGSLMNLNKKMTTPHRIILLATLSYCIVLCVFLALSTPNFGTLSRYRVGFLPFFVFVIAYGNPITKWMSDKLDRNAFNIN